MADPITDPDPNSYISKLIGGFLIDLAKAQHMSNEYSKRLGEIYKNDPLLRVFPVPNGCINGVTMELKAGIQGIGVVNNPPEAVLEHAHAIFKRHVEELLEPVLADVSAALRSNRQLFSSEGKADRMAGALDRPAWRAAIAHEVLELINPQMSRMVSPQGDLNEEATGEILEKAVIQAAVDHSDYAELGSDVREGLRKQVKGKAADPDRMGRLRSRLANRPATTEPSLKVTTADANLTALGPELVGRLDLQAAVRDYLVQAETVPSDALGAPPLVVFRLIPAKH
jgi:hypothetical protein